MAFSDGSSSSGIAGQPMAHLEAQAQNLIPGDVRMISGCADSQTSADVSNMGSFQLPVDVGLGGAGGACSGSFASVIMSSSSLTWSTLLSDMRNKLIERRFQQVPQLSSSRNLALDDRFQVIPNGARPKRAVFIGINYVGMQGELRGCHNDADMIKKIVTQKLGMGAAEVKVLKDDGGQSEAPTRMGILNAFSWLVEGARSGDALFFHYSGHGGYVTDTSGDEKDNRDETIVPVDYNTAGQILDDEIYKLLVLKVPAGVTLTVIMDCCHSGSVFDLPFYYLQTNEMDPDAPTPVMQPNPQFSWKKVFDLGMKLYRMHESGASMSQIRSTAMMELEKDPSMREGLMTAASSAAKMLHQFSNGSLGGGNAAATPAYTGNGSSTNASNGSSFLAQSASQHQQQPSHQSSSGSSMMNMAKLGAGILLAANEAGSQPNPAAGFASFMGRAAKLF